MQLALGLGYAALIIYVANLAALNAFQVQWVRWMLYGICLLLATLAITVLPESASSGGLLMSLVTLVGAATAALLVGHAPTRQRLRHWLPASVSYDPNSIVHATALVMIVFQLMTGLISFQLAGGLEGIASDAAATPTTTQELLLDVGLNVLFALGGVGLYLRRDLKQTLQRLGVRLPTITDLGLGLVVGVALYFLVDQAAALWQSLTPPEIFQQQTAAADALFVGFTQTPLLMLMLPLASALGEEFLYRGALQPVFGITLTTVFFVLLHTQYLGTPAMLIIAGVGLTLALLRRYTSTTAAIIAHFVYNMVPFLLLASGAS